MPQENDYRIELQRAMDVFKSSIQSPSAKAREERLRKLIDEVAEEEPTDEELEVVGSDDIKPAQAIGNGPARYSPSLEHEEPAKLVEGMERTYNIKIRIPAVAFRAKMNRSGLYLNLIVGRIRKE